MKFNKIQTPSGQPLPEQRGDHLQYLLTAYLFENISAAGKQEVEAHVEICAECRAELAALQATLGQVQEALEPESANTTPYSFEARRLERVLQAAKRRRTRWDWLRERPGLWGLAAAAALVMGLGGLMLPPLLTTRKGASRPDVGSQNVTVSSAFLSENENFVSEILADDGVTNTAATLAPASRIELARAPDGIHALDVRAPTTVAISNPDAPPAAAEPPAAAGEVGKDLLAAVPQDQPARLDANQAREGYTLRARGTDSSGKRAEPSEPASTFDDKERLLAKADLGPPNNPGALGGAGLTDGAPTAPAALPQATVSGGIKPGVTFEKLAAEEAPAPAQPAKPAGEVTRKFAAGNRRQDAAGAPPATEGDTRRFNKSRGERDEVAAEVPQGTGLEHATNLSTHNATRDQSQPLAESRVPPTVWSAPSAESARQDHANFFGRQHPRGDDGVLKEKLLARSDVVPGKLEARYSEDVAELQPSRDEPAAPVSGPEPALPPPVLEKNLRELAVKNGRMDGVEAKNFADLLADSDSFATSEVDRSLQLLGQNTGAPRAAGAVAGVVDSKAEPRDESREKANADALPAQGLTRILGEFDANKKADFMWGDHLQGETREQDLELGKAEKNSQMSTADGESAVAADTRGLNRDKLQVWDEEAATRAGVNLFEQSSGDKNGSARTLDTIAGLGTISDGDGDVRSLAEPELLQQSIKQRQSGHEVQALDLLQRSRGAAVAPADGRVVPAQIAATAERQLRAYHYYRELDPALSPDVFFKQTLVVPPPAVGDEGLGEAGFRSRHGVHPFVDTSRDRFSTFGMDVDTASYTLARANLLAGKLPDPKTVRVEEFINYFRESIEADLGAVFTVRCEGGPAPFGAGVELLKISVKARELLPNERKNAVLTFAVDTSGSMNLDNRLAYVRGALETLLASLQPADRVAIVAFGATPYLVLPHTAARDKERLLAAVRSLVPSGGTNVEAGLDLAYRIADEVFDHKGVNRVILCSDGVANVGARGPDEILRKVEVFAKRGLYLSALGVGLGKYNDSMLETIANKGNGNYAYVDSSESATEVFRNNLPSTLQVLAQDAKIQVDFNPDVVGHYRLLGYENRDIADKDFRNDKVDAGEVGPGSTVTALYEIHRKPSSSGDLGKVFLRYRDTGTGRVDEVNFPLPPGVIATSVRATSDQFRFIACAAETAELLRGSYWARNGSFGAVLDMLETLSPETRARNEWQDLNTVVRAAQTLSLPQLSRIEKR